MRPFIFSENKLQNILTIHWGLIIYFVFILLLGFTLDNIGNSYLNFLKWNVIVLFFWIYFSLGYSGMPFYHPYRMFLIAFFAFLLGRVLMDILGLAEFEKGIFFYAGLKFSVNTQFKIFALLIIFLLFIHLAAIFFYTDIVSEVLPHWKYNERYYRLGYILFWIWLIPAIIYWYQYITYVFEHGYRNLTADDQIISSNFVIKLADDFFTIGYFFILASKPDIKKLRWPTLIYILVMLCTLLTGRRIFFFTQMLMLVTYFGFREKLSKKVVLVLGIIMMMVAVIVGIYRSLSEFSFTESVKYDNIIVDFFQTQGISIHAVGLTIDYNEKDLLERDIQYLIEPFKNFALQLGSAFGIPYQKPIQDNYFLADRITHIYEVNMLSRGGGLGSSIVAEFYIVAGIFGVLIGSFIYGFIIMLIVGKWLRTNFGMMVAFLLLPLLYFTPRAHPLVPFTESIKPLIIVLVLLFLAKIFKIESLFGKIEKNPNKISLQ